MSKKNKYLILFLLILSFQVFKAQSLQDSVSVLISPGTNNKAELNDIKTKILVLPNIHYVGFCNNHKVFLVYVDPNIHGTPEVFLANLIKSSGILSLQLKTGTINDILGFCEFNDPTEYNKNKLLQGH